MHLPSEIALSAKRRRGRGLPHIQRLWFESGDELSLIF